MNYSSLNTFFDHIYIVTLPRAKDRQALIAVNLKGLNFSFFEGFDKNDFIVPELIANGVFDKEKSSKVHRYNKKMTPGQIGCAWSHRAIYQDIIANNYNKVLILEDDVYTNTDVNRLFDLMITELPKNWELLYLDYNRNKKYNPLKRFVYHIQRMMGAIKWNHTVIKNFQSKKFSSHLRQAGFHDYTSAYAITNSAAKKLLERQTPIAYVADNLLGHAICEETIKAYTCVPKLFHQLSQGDLKQIPSYVD